MMLATATALVAALHVAGAQTVNDDDTGRELLFSDSMADLPDVIISADGGNHVSVTEGGSFFYTVKLSHKPGVREDNTVDLLNDEVRIYLTSSQEVYQQGTQVPVARAGPGDPPAGTAEFSSLLGHRTQLQIDTNQYTFVYVAYSTKNPSQASTSLIDAANYDVVCPLCTHPKYCLQHKNWGIDVSSLDIIPTSNLGFASNAFGGAETPGFDGCLKATYVGYAPVAVRCQATAHHTPYVADRKSVV